MIKLQRFAQTELDRATRVCSQHSIQSLTFLEASDVFKNCEELFDHLIGRIAKHVAGGTSGGDDIAAEVLSDVWQACSNVAAQNQSRFWAEVESARARAAVLEKAQLKSRGEEGGHTGGKLEETKTRVKSVTGDGSTDDEGEEEREEEDETKDEVQMKETLGVDQMNAAVEDATKRAEAVAAVIIGELKAENERLHNALETAKREISAVVQRADALENLATGVMDAECRALEAEEERDAVVSKLGQMTPRPIPEHRELQSLLGSSGTESALAALQAHPELTPVDLSSILLRSVEDDCDGIDPGSPVLNFNLSCRGAAASTGVSAEALTAALERSFGTTAQRYVKLESHIVSLAADCATLRSELEVFREQERGREAARRRREEEAQLESKNAVERYLDLLASQGEEVWKDQLIGMGQGPDVPKIFRHAGKIRNKHLSKRETEKLVKEVWKERLSDPAVVAGRAGELVEFLGQYLQKRVGIAAAVIELGYNFLYGLWTYQWDADCELFLKSLCGQVREEVYIAQARLQEDLEELFAALDKAKGQATGVIPKASKLYTLNEQETLSVGPLLPLRTYFSRDFLHCSCNSQHPSDLLRFC